MDRILQTKSFANQRTPDLFMRRFGRTTDPVEGLCRCGCGESTSIAKKTDKRRGWIRGLPIQHVGGHQHRQSIGDAILKYSVETGNCWPWIGPRIPSGYGVICYGRRKLLAHRVVYEFFRGSIPDGHSVLHTCDNPSCVRPDHLFTGTLWDNMADMVTKGRQAKGERCVHAKLTDDQVIRILNAARSRENSQIELAKIHNVSPATICEIVNRKSWKHVQVEPYAR